MKQSLVGTFALGFLLTAMNAAGEDIPDPMAAAKVSIAVPVRNGHKSLNDGDHFHVLLTNVSGKPLRLWTDRYSWGYANLSFELVDEAGKVTRIAKKPRGWSKNYPDWLEVEAGGSYVLSVDWTSEQGRGLWENAPSAMGRERPTLVKIRAVYEVQLDDESRKLGVWTGKVTSPVETYAIW